MTHGGKRENAGRKRGVRNAKTLERQKILEAYQQRVMRMADRLFDAQLSLACGQQFLFRVDIDAKMKQRSRSVLISDEETIRAYLEGEYENDALAEYYYFTTKEPNNRAIESLLDRTFGKPTQSIDVTSAGEPIPLLGNARNKK